MALPPIVQEILAPPAPGRVLLPCQVRAVEIGTQIPFFEA
jgi:hypothetical protein